jgi:Xaa-Pro aminopeptidase
MGTLIVTQNQAGLWADSRYWEQAAKNWTAAASR